MLNSNYIGTYGLESVAEGSLLVSLLTYNCREGNSLVKGSVRITATNLLKVR